MTIEYNSPYSFDHTDLDALDAEVAEAIFASPTEKMGTPSEKIEPPKVEITETEALSEDEPSEVEATDELPKTLDADESTPLAAETKAVEEEPTPFESTPIVPIGYSVKDGNPSLGGVEISELTKRYGTPLYVVDAESVRWACRQYLEPLETHYPEEALVVYACKANMSLGLVKLMQQEGMGLDVVSAGELYTAMKAEFPPERVLFNGNNKSRTEIEMALDYGVRRIVVDNLSELDLLAEVAKARKRQVNVLLRVAPGIEAHTHDYIKTGQNDSKFGFSLQQLGPTIQKIQGEYSEQIQLKGLHAHIGSQIFELTAYEDLVKILLNIYYNVRESFDGLTLGELDLGGGWGIAYTNSDNPMPIPELIETASQRLKDYAEKLSFPLPKLYLEPGRSIMARAGVTLYTVGSRKDLEGYPSYIAVDGGMGDNIRPALYQADYTAVVANKLRTGTQETIKLVGKYCESGDVVLPRFAGPRLERGDTVMVFSTGAYNYAMASNYNRIPKPATVMVENGESAILVERESLDDLLAFDRIPSWLLD